MTYRELSKEFDKESVGSLLNPDMYPESKYELDSGRVKDFLKAKINQVIDEMIGEEKKMNWKKEGMEREKKDGVDGWKTTDPEIAGIIATRIGYNQKRAELILFKKKFNQN